MFDFIKNFLKGCSSDTTLENNWSYANLFGDYYGLRLIPILPLHDKNVTPISIDDILEKCYGKNNEIVLSAKASFTRQIAEDIERCRENGWDIYENDQGFSLGYRHYYKDVVVKERNKKSNLIKRRMKLVNKKMVV